MSPATEWSLVLVVGGAVGTVVAVGWRRIRTRYRWLRTRQRGCRTLSPQGGIGAPLVAGVAHDIKNAMLPIVCLSDSLRRAVRIGELSCGDVEEKAALIYRAAVQASALTHKLLSYALLASNTDLRISDKGLVDLKALLRDGLRWLSPWRPPNVDFDVRLPADVVYVTGDPHSLLRAVLNLGTSAMSSLSSGGQLRLELRLDDGETALLEVGATFRGARHPRRADPAGAVPGAKFRAEFHESKVIVEAHGGRLDTTSSAGTGFTFTVRLPLSRELDFPALPAPPGVASARKENGQ